MFYTKIFRSGARRKCQAWVETCQNCWNIIENWTSIWTNVPCGTLRLYCHSLYSLRKLIDLIITYTNLWCLLWHVYNIYLCIRTFMSDTVSYRHLNWTCRSLKILSLVISLITSVISRVALHRFNEQWTDSIQSTTWHTRVKWACVQWRRSHTQNILLHHCRL